MSSESRQLIKSTTSRELEVAIKMISLAKTKIEIQKYHLPKIIEES